LHNLSLLLSSIDRQGHLQKALRHTRHQIPLCGFRPGFAPNRLREEEQRLLFQRHAPQHPNENYQNVHIGSHVEIYNPMGHVL